MVADQIDAKETIVAMLHEFGKQASCSQTMIADLTQKICIVIDIMKQNNTLEYYHNALQEFVFAFNEDPVTPTYTATNENKTLL